MTGPNCAVPCMLRCMDAFYVVEACCAMLCMLCAVLMHALLCHARQLLGGDLTPTGDKT